MSAPNEVIRNSNVKRAMLSASQNVNEELFTHVFVRRLWVPALDPLGRNDGEAASSSFRPNERSEREPETIITILSINLCEG
jgi:hypothetical protein